VPLSFSLRAPVVALLAAMLFWVMPSSARSAEIVDLPAIPPARRTVALEEVWRVGGGDNEVLLGLVSSGVLDDDGNVLLADRQLCRVVVISPTGEFLGTLGREGDGPGELRRLQSVFVAGERVGLVQGFPGKVVYLDRDGIPAGGFKLGDGAEQVGLYAIRDLRCAGPALVAHTDRSSDDFNADRSSTRSTLSVLGLDGVFKAELASHEVARGMRNIVLDEAASWAEFDCWAVSPRGVVATVAERDAWAVNERDLDGALLRVLRRPCRARKRTAEEKEEAVSRIRLSSVVAGATMEKRPLDTDPVIVDLQCAADGRLFVTTCHNAREQLTEDVAGRFDVITLEGKYLEELTLTFAGHDPQQDVLVFLDGTRFLVLRNYADAEKAIHAAFLPKEEQEDLSEAEPLEVVLVKVPDQK
jgi:hypothetical protein